MQCVFYKITLSYYLKSVRAIILFKTNHDRLSFFAFKGFPKVRIINQFSLTISYNKNEIIE